MYALLFTSHVMRDTLLELFNFLYFMEKGKGETVFCSSTADIGSCFGTTEIFCSDFFLKTKKADFWGAAAVRLRDY